MVDDTMSMTGRNEKRETRLPTDVVVAMVNCDFRRIEVLEEVVLTDDRCFDLSGFKPN